MAGRVDKTALAIAGGGSLGAVRVGILADATNLGLARMAQASQGVTRDQLVWTADAFIRNDTYKAALARIIDATTPCRYRLSGVTGPPPVPMGSSSVRASAAA